MHARAPLKTFTQSIACVFSPDWLSRVSLYYPTKYFFAIFIKDRKCGFMFENLNRINTLRSSHCLPPKNIKLFGWVIVHAATVQAGDLYLSLANANKSNIHVKYLVGSFNRL